MNRCSPNVVNTADGRNPAPPSIETLQIIGETIYQLVQDFFHPQYVNRCKPNISPKVRDVLLRGLPELTSRFWSPNIGVILGESWRLEKLLNCFLFFVYFNDS